MMLYRHVRREFRRLCVLEKRSSFVYVMRRWMEKKNNIKDTRKDWLIGKQNADSQTDRYV